MSEKRTPKTQSVSTSEMACSSSKTEAEKFNYDIGNFYVI